ncbi:DUF1294 domain-containing protein [Deinococcus pimensis]|uniref:DUF1294 domain-containing protein n=1 Tax=Deinococcus pimensis TaxID=309888 RepID=UPI0004B9FAD1|nr:DUF1294 domain-containing protein [Deinococcus pimensis]
MDLLGLVWTRSPGLVLLAAWTVGLSAVTFAVYARDKRAAARGGWRTPEVTLHLLALCGGWPGALLAQRTLRHKTRKLIFRVVFVLTVLANLLVLTFAGLVASRGA